MRQIKASEVKPGMTIRWEGRGFIHEGLVERTTAGVYPRATRVLSGQFGMDIPEDAEVTVLSEPQPEEPTEFGLKARVRKGRFVRLHEGLAGSDVWFEEGTGYRWSWDDLCEMGPVTVVPDQGWTVPADVPEVPERIEEWPEDDTALRPYKWRGRDGRPWVYSRTYGRWYNFSSTAISKLVTDEPKFGPWTRVTDA